MSTDENIIWHRLLEGKKKEYLYESYGKEKVEKVFSEYEWMLKNRISDTVGDQSEEKDRKSILKPVEDKNLKCPFCGSDKRFNKTYELGKHVRDNHMDISFPPTPDSSIIRILAWYKKYYLFTYMINKYIHR